MALKQTGPPNLYTNRGSFERMNKLPKTQLEHLINPLIVE